jgi:hypothetical protein
MYFQQAFEKSEKTLETSDLAFKGKN